MQRFREHVREALTHLHDLPYLETHPLSESLVAHYTGEVRGQALQRMLLAAIQALKPLPGLPDEALAWRKYRYLYFRYIQDRHASEIASELGISERQSRRYALEALYAVAHILWDQQSDVARRSERDRELFVGADTYDRAQRLNPTLADQGHSQVEQEVARPGAAHVAEAPIPELMASVVAMAGSLATSRGIHLQATIPASRQVVAAEPSVLCQVLLGLVSLSLDFGAVSITLLARAESVRSECVLSISSELAEPVALINARLLTDERWRVVEHLLEMQGGSLDFELTQSQLLTVRLRLQPPRLRKVLIAGDNPDAPELYRRFFSDSPYVMLPLVKDEEPLDLATRELPEVILLDLMMPADWDLLRLFRHARETRDTPIVVCSVLKEQDLALALGASAFLVKPITRQDLLEVLDRCSRFSEEGPRG